MIIKKKKLLFLVGLVLVGLVFILVSYFRASVQPSHIKEMVRFHKALEESEPAFTAEDVETAIKELIELVEYAAGKKFKRIPEVKIADRKELVKVLARDFHLQLRNQISNKSERQILETAEQQAKSIAPTILGKYGFSNKVLYLMPRNYFPILKLAKIDKKHIKPIMEIIIAHELTHALQDQELDLKNQILGIKGYEELEAYNATIEGHAVFIQELVGKQLKLDDNILELSRRLVSGKLVFKEPMLEMLHNMGDTRIEIIYFGGKKFIEYHYMKGGNQKVWEILASPPIDTAMIIKPETYSSISRKKLDYENILTGLEKHFGHNEWNVEHIEIPKTLLLSTFASLDSNTREEIISKIAHAQAIKISNKNGDYGSVTIILLKDDSYGSKLISMVERIEKNNAERLKNSTMYKMEDLIIKNLIEIKADAARKLSFTLKSANGRSVKTVIVRICNDDVVFEIIDSNIHLTDKEIIKIYETVYQRFLEARAQQKKEAALIF